MTSRAKPFGIRTMNKISAQGLSLFGSDYQISDANDAPDAILVRSAQVDTDLFPTALAVARAGAGVNNITIDKASEKGVCVFNTPGANANAVAELVFDAMGAAARNIIAGNAWIKSLEGMTDDKEISAAVEKGKGQFAGVELRGRTLGVIGLGKIGVLVANGGVARGMSVIAYEPYPSIGNMHALHPAVRITSNLEEVMRTADAVSMHGPLTPNTKNLINADMIAAMRDGAILCNFSRGGIVDEAATVAALDAGKLRAYVTDFASQTTLKCPKCINFPHLGASTAEAEENCATMAVEQLKLYLEHGVVRNSVNFPAIAAMPAAGTKTRLVIVNRDVPNMIAAVTKILGDAGVNIQSFKNESNGKIGYNLVDLACEIDDGLVKSIEAAGDVLKVRVIKY